MPSNTPHQAQIFDKRMAARLDRLYASPQVVGQRARLREVLAAQPGEVGVDVGCGLGHLSVELAREVASDVARDVTPCGRIVGVDASADMVAGAVERVTAAGLSGAFTALQCDATALQLPDASADFVVAVQSYSYVKDIERAIAEAARVLRPGGRLAVLETDWDLCLYASPDSATMRAIFDPRWRFEHGDLPRRLNGLFRGAGLKPQHASAIALVESSYDAESFGVGMLAIARNAAVRHGVDANRADAWVADVQARGQADDYFFCLNRFIFVARK